MPLHVGKSRLKIGSVSIDFPVYAKIAIRTHKIVMQIPTQDPKMNESVVELYIFLANYLR